MGCANSVNVSKPLLDSFKINQSWCIYSIDQLTQEELLYLKRKIQHAHIELKHFNKNRHNELQYINISSEMLKKIYFLCNRDSVQYYILLSQLDKNNQIPFNSKKIKPKLTSNSLQYIIRLFCQKYFQNLTVFFKNNSHEESISFQQFVKMYSILTKTPVKSEVFSEVLFSFLVQGLSLLDLSQFKQFLRAINVEIQQFQSMYYDQQQKNKQFLQKNSKHYQNQILIEPIPTLINKQKFIKFLKFLKKSDSINKKIEEFQSKFTLIDNVKQIYQEYFQINQLFIDQQLNQIATEPVYIVSKKWYEHFFTIFHKVFEEKVLRVRGKEQRKQNFLKINEQKNSKKQQKKKISEIKISEVTESNPYAILKSLKLETKQIEGEYRQELKQQKHPLLAFKPITSNLYKKMSDFLYQNRQDFTQQRHNQTNQPAKKQKVEFIRSISSNMSIEYYPILAFLLKTDKKGKIRKSAIQSMVLPHSLTFQQLKLLVFSQQELKKDVFNFVKLFEEKNFQQQTNELIKIHSLAKNSKLIIALTFNREGFISNNYRKEISRENLFVGDGILAFSQKYQCILPCYVLAIDQQKKKIRVHFIGKSWRDEVYVDVQSIYLSNEEFEDAQQRPKKYAKMFTGLANIGNTCYINSSIQSLLSTEIFSQLLNRQPLSKSLFSYQMKVLFQFLQSQPSQQTQQQFMKKPTKEIKFQQTVVDFFKQFQHWQQQDTQEFIHAVLDQISQEKKFFIENIFNFTFENQLICESKSCNSKRINNQTMNMITLPIPEPKQIYIQILMVFIYKNYIQKLYIKLQQSSTFGELIRIFQERSHSQFNQFIMVQTQNGIMKKIRKDFTQSFKDPDSIRLQQLGIISDFNLTAYEIIKQNKIIDLVKRKNRNREKKQREFYDFFDKYKKAWTVAKISTKDDLIIVKYISKDLEIIKVQIPKAQFDNQNYLIQSLGVKTMFNEPIHIGLSMRKQAFSVIDQKKIMQNFGFSFVVALPLWFSYSDCVSIINQQLQRIIANAQNNQDYIIRFLQRESQVCIFCESQVSNKTLNSDGILKKCCQIFQDDAPLLFLAKFKSFRIYLDWKSLKYYNDTFTSTINMDRASEITEEQHQLQKVSLYQCFNFLRIREQVEMNCEVCKNTKMVRQESIASLPPILIIQLKKYRFIHQKETLVNLNTNLRYEEIKKIDIGQYLSQSSVLRDSINYSSIYELYSVIKHVGRGNSGHYTSVCKRRLRNGSDEEVWVFFDDSTTKIVNEFEIKNYMSNAYMLFYRKIYLGVDTRLKLKLI